VDEQREIKGDKAMGWLFPSDEDDCIQLKESALTRTDEFGRCIGGTDWVANMWGDGLVPIKTKFVMREEICSMTETTLSAGPFSLSVRNAKKKVVWYAVDQRGQVICDLQTYLMNTDPQYARLIMQREKRNR
jgi:hypothetical protein